MDEKIVVREIKCFEKLMFESVRNLEFEKVVVVCDDLFWFREWVFGVV